ncbi:transporter substrate-binding domain-containing protein [Paenibacillus sp. BSR1-1]|uniref:transporter substrate-binding domain-containing protein n=1 Tax=Paenibacillus sp. BSR1-1 TaxID=3020845 RepID=UPI0025B185DE|nr:transporter substrate-binding domain-containing protein [Paenibacillus sp. BSR1-1]MDN3015497.1 transporter substrate-binding domain-containing protein [Paenibacillus sp. BSR1-1]
MFKTKHIVKLVLVTIVAALFLAGCGKDKASTGSSKDVLAKIKEDKKIVFGVKYDTRLFGLKNPKTGEVEGFDIDLSKALAEEMFGKDVKPEYVEVTSKTRVGLLNNGKVDAVVATMTITDERKKEVDFTDVYFDAGQSLLVKKGSKIQGLQDLKKGTTVLAVKGSTSAINIREKAPETTVLEYENYAEAFTALKAGKGDALTTDDSILYGMVEEDPSFQLVGGTFTEEPYGIAVKKGNQELVDALNKALKSLKDSGKYDEIKNKWIKN